MKRLLIILLLLPILASAQRSYVTYWSTKYLRNTEGDIVITSSGDIISYFTRFYGGASDFSGSEIYSKVSHDGGKTWYNNGISQANLSQNTMSVSTLYEGDSITLFFLVRNSPTDIRPYRKVSHDNGVTWSDPAPIFGAAGYWVMNNNRVIRTLAGRLIAPVARVSNINNFIAGTEAFTSSVWYSDDNGATWTESNRITVPTAGGAMEPGVVEISAGNILMYIRVRTGGRQYFSTSSNNGETWSSSYQSTLASPEAPAKIIKLADGRLLAAHINNTVNQTRRPLVLSVSSDGGTTWTVKYTLGDNNISWFVYPSVMEKDGYIYITYWEQITAKTVFSLAFEKIELSKIN